MEPFEFNLAKVRSNRTGGMTYGKKFEERSVR